MSRTLYRFHGGIHLDDKKVISSHRSIAKAPIPETLIIPLQQNIGAESAPVVEIGTHVLKGELIANAGGFVGAPIHAPTSGTITAIEKRPVIHPSGEYGLVMVLQSDGKDQWIELERHDDYLAMDPPALRRIIQDAGIVGLGGAGFPAFIKLNPGARVNIDTLIINGAECEPYITCDDRLMQERAEEVIFGIRIMMHAVQTEHCLIGIEDNKPDAYHAMQQAAIQISKSIEVVKIPTIYPTGGEKQLIQVLTGKEVPSQGIPLDVGIVCHNVATAVAVNQAVIEGKPLISRIITVTGERVKTPQNFEVLMGTPISELISLAGGTTISLPHYIIGGPMMGIPVEDIDAPVVKTSSALLIQDPPKDHSQHSPCIRCGECANVCPIKLLPQQLYWHARSRDMDTIQDFNLFDCIECGCCSYVCPSQIPLVHYYRFAKTTIWTQEQEKKAAEIARQRHEFKLQRKQREKDEKAAKAKARKEALAAKANTSTDEDPKKAAIKAAMERAKAKKAAANTSEQPATTDMDADKQAKIKAALERAKAKKAASAQKRGETLPDDEKQAKIEEALARAKAKKAAAEQTPEAPVQPQNDDKAAAIKAAIERSKAKKAEAAKRKVQESEE